MVQTFLGGLIDGSWVEGEGTGFSSHNPAQNHNVVATGTGVSPVQVRDAVAAAVNASASWMNTPYEERKRICLGIEAVAAARKEDLARAMTAEMGKPLREALGEAGSLLGKVKVSTIAQEKLPDLALPNAPGESRWKAHGAVGIIGPYNYPVHLIHTHLMPALLAGNTVVFKPSEVTPLTGQIYGEILAEMDLPPGVVNMVQGGGDVGAALAQAPELGGLCFTGSWGTGRRILESNLDQPWKLLALEMGGRNAAVVMEDADIAQAVHEVVIGACLTAGQRCTATSRVLVHKDVADVFTDALCHALENIAPGDPLEDSTLLGPMATKTAFDRYQESLKQIESGGIPALVPTRVLPGGAFVTPSLHKQEAADAHWDDYVREELFGPDIALEVIESDEDALGRLNKSLYGLSQSVFTASEARFEKWVSASRCGIFNWNRSTNNASGLLPFGGLGQSGNFRPAGAGSALYASYPVAVLKREYGVVDWDPRFGPIVQQALAVSEEK